MAAGHHGPHCVIHNCNYVQVELLQRKQSYCKVGCAHQVVSGGVYQPKGGHRVAEQRDLGKGARSGMSLNTVTYISPLDGFPEHVHHVFPFTVSGLEAFGPLNECCLKERRRNSFEQQFAGTTAQPQHQKDAKCCGRLLITRPGSS